MTEAGTKPSLYQRKEKGGIRERKRKSHLIKLKKMMYEEARGSPGDPVPERHCSRSLGG